MSARGHIYANCETRIPPKIHSMIVQPAMMYGIDRVPTETGSARDDV